MQFARPARKDEGALDNVVRLCHNLIKTDCRLTIYRTRKTGRKADKSANRIRATALETLIPWGNWNPRSYRHGAHLEPPWKSITKHYDRRKTVHGSRGSRNRNWGIPRGKVGFCYVSKIHEKNRSESVIAIVLSKRKKTCPKRNGISPSLSSMKELVE